MKKIKESGRVPVSHLNLIMSGSKLSLKQFLKLGAPFMAIMIGGSVTVSKVLEHKYNREGGYNSRSLSEKESMYVLKENDFDLNEELAKIEREIDINNWENVRIKRPDETALPIEKN